MKFNNTKLKLDFLLKLIGEGNTGNEDFYASGYLFRSAPCSAISTAYVKWVTQLVIACGVARIT
jgi:hypothetical protein